VETIGRDAERGELGRWLQSPEPPVLLIEGEAGIGKSTLWRAGVGDAEQLGIRILACTAAGSETQLAFTTLRDVFADAFDDVADELPPPQRRALGTTLLREESGHSPPDPGAIAVASVTALAATAADRPTLVAIDDVQWVDDASAGALSYVLRRIATARVAVLLARRRDAPGPRPLGLDALTEEQVRILDLGPLSIGALGRILRERLGTPYPRPTLHRLHETSGGNPFYALELARALEDSSAPLRPGAALPVPGTLQALVEERLNALPGGTVEALRIVAALSRPGLEAVGRALDADPSPLLEPAVAAQVVDVDEDEVRFTHPLFAAAAYGFDPRARRELHGRLARVVSDPEERARHLALGTEEPDGRVAQAIEDGAALAFARGSPAAAAQLEAEARRLTPPAEAERALRRAVAEVDFDFEAGDTAAAAELLEGLLAEAPAGRARALLLSRRARLRHFGEDIGRSVDLLYEALAEAEGDDALRGEIEEGLAWGLLLVRRDLDGAASHAASAARIAKARGDRSALAEALAAQAVTRFVTGDDSWAEPMGRAIALEDDMAGLRVLRLPSFAYGYCLSCSDRLDEAREVFSELERRARDAGDESSLPSILNHRTLIEGLAGRWDEAVAYADAGYERAVESGQHPTQVSILAKRALVAARRGDVGEARSGALSSLSLAGADLDPSTPEQAMARGGETAIWTLGFLALSDGDPEQAHGLLGPMVDALLAAGVREPGEVRSLDDDVEALLELGLLDEAEARVRVYEEWAERLQRPSALAGARHCRGLLHATRGDGEAAIAALTVAVALHDGVPKPFERARTLLALGTQQRRARHRRAARETLGVALAGFEELGARKWTERAQAELERIGGRAPSPDGLTPTEQRVAALVSEGKSNKEVAAELVISVHTVESALTSIYRKLDVRSRTELARKLTTHA
jgi:DNA-binding CsgD family transcriptional regulator